MNEILCYDDFVNEISRAGFSMGGGNSEGIFAVIPWDWCDEPPYATPVKWHTGDQATDPWEWRIRILNEQLGISYAKCFFKKGGFITKEWYPYFLAARRRRQSAEEAFYEGTLSREAKTLYEHIAKSGKIALHDLKLETGFGKEKKALFERVLVELQMKLFITINGSKQKLSAEGTPFGWHSTVFSTTESFWDGEVFEEAGRISKQEAIEAISDQILLLNPSAPEKKIRKFICG